MHPAHRPAGIAVGFEILAEREEVGLDLERAVETAQHRELARGEAEVRGAREALPHVGSIEEKNSAVPRKEKKPTTSVMVVRMMDEAVAGS